MAYRVYQPTYSVPMTLEVGCRLSMLHAQASYACGLMLKLRLKDFLRF